MKDQAWAVPFVHSRHAGSRFIGIAIMKNHSQIADNRLHLITGEVGKATESIDRLAFTRFRAVFDDPGQRWFFSGQGRSGLVAQMAAMRLMHAGYETHVVGEATAPAVRKNDGILLVSKSGTTPISLGFARKARDQGALVAALTSDASSPLAVLADASLEIPTAFSVQFAGSLFEQAALLCLDALALDISGTEAQAFIRMANRHTNMQ
jgi:6-phospho-3-hexuloisomerase